MLRSALIGCFTVQLNVEQVQEKKKHMRDREMSEKMKRLKMKMEVQEITFNYFARPQPRDLNFYVMMMMAIQKILLSVVSKFVVGVCDGLDACEISRPEIMSQSAPDFIHYFEQDCLTC